jgi:hypothetical protein
MHHTCTIDPVRGELHNHPDVLNVPQGQWYILRASFCNHVYEFISYIGWNQRWTSRLPDIGSMTRKSLRMVLHSAMIDAPD